jgi:hypothetical protein
MPDGRHDSSLTRVQPFFEALFARDPSGRSWLPALLGATENGPARLGELVEAPGYLETPLAVRGVGGRLACFDYPTGPPRDLLRWFIDHPDELTWPPGAELSAETIRLRRALLRDDPPGSRHRAQQRARELVAGSAPLTPRWWRFEDVSKLDCVLITDRLVVTIEGKRTEPLLPATEWYPQRSQLIRTLEAAKQLAQGKTWASILISEALLGEASRDDVGRSLPVSAPHLDDGARREVHAAYLGNLTSAAACAAVGTPAGSLPDTTKYPQPAEV